MGAPLQFALVVILFGLSAALPGSNPCSRGPGHWCSSLGAARTCGALAHCAQLWSQSSNPQPDPADSSEACATCRLLAEDLTSLAAAGADRMRSAGAAACGLVPDADASRACRRLLSGPANLPELLAAGLQAGKACVMADQCRRLLPTAPQLAASVDTLQAAAGTKGSCNACPSVLDAIGASVIRVGISPAHAVARLRRRVCPGLASPKQQSMCRQLAGRRDLYNIVLQLARGVKPKQVCATFRLCNSTPLIGHPVIQLMRLQARKGSRPAESIQCQACEDLVSQARTMLRNGRTQAEIESFVESLVCNSLPPSVKDQCVKNVKEYGPILFQLLASELDPKTVCEALGACGKTSMAIESGRASKKLKASTQCLICEFVMREVEQQLGQNATQAEVEAALQKVCSLLPQSVRQECDDFVQQYTPIVIQLLVNGLSPQRICTTLGLCSQMKQPMSARATPVVASANCDTCQTVVVYVKTLLKENATEQEAIDTVEKVCNFLPTAERATCKTFVDHYGPYVIQLLLQELNPMQICQLIGLCTQKTLPTSERTQKPIRASPQCLICEFVMREVEQQLGQNATQAEVEAALQRVCSLLPQSVRQECNDFVQQYTPIVIQLLVNGLSPQRICTAIGLCTSSNRASLPRVQKPVQASPQCLICEFVMREVEQQLGQNATQAEVEAALQRVCSLLPQSVRQECDAFVQQYTPIVIQLLVNGLSPQRICTEIGLCSQRAPLHRPAPSKSHKPSSTVCDVCQTVIQYAKSLMQENATEEEVVQLLQRVCSFLPTAEQAACKSFIEQYGEYVIQLLLQDANPRQICQLLGLCTSQKPLPRAFRPRLSSPLPDRTLRFVRPARGFPATANGLVQMVRDRRRQAEPIV